MAQETELKLALFARDLPRLLAHPLLAAQVPQRQRLLNTYFDTPDLALMRQRIAVRERRVGRRTLLTVKTAGASAGGLSRRGEWEGPTQTGELDFPSLVDDAALARALTRLKPRLVPLFRTDFTRRSWQLSHGGAVVEVALDEGAINTGNAQGNHRQAILELELELLSGPVDALLDLAHTLALGPQGQAGGALRLLPAQQSKAERGYALFTGERPRPLKAAELALEASWHPVQAFQAAALGRGHFQFLGDQVGKEGDAVAMAGGVRAFGIDDTGKTGGDVVEIVFVCHDRLAAGFQRQRTFVGGTRAPGVARLLARWPDYNERVARFIMADPLAPRRIALEQRLQSLAATGPQRDLFG